MSALGIFGAALFYGDAVITPAMSVLSAVEGLEVATPLLKPYVLPITDQHLVLLFFFQRHGTAAVGALFGPLMMFWFATLGLLGLWNVIQYPSVLAAINPWYAVKFFIDNQGLAYLALGSVVLAITGGEALYADMGHFGRRSIKWAWFAFVFPLLYLNYLGQGALILNDPKAIESPFFLMAPSEILLIPLVILATVATVIASQAVISGAFSLTSQAMQLGYCPRIQVRFHLGARKGPDLRAEHQLAAAADGDHRRARLPLVVEPGFGLRHRRHADDDDRHDSRLCRRARLVEVELAARGAVSGVLRRRRLRFLFGQRDQDPRRRLVPAGAGLFGVRPAFHLEARSQTAL
jgi:hypothetical protein